MRAGDQHLGAGARSDYLPGEERSGAVVLRVPALRERREDIPDLVDAAMRAIGQRVRVRHRAMAALMAHEWPATWRS